MRADTIQADTMDEEKQSDYKSLSLLQRFNQHSLAEVDLMSAAPVLTLMCLITGFTDAVSFTACFIWPGFQTGNTTQLGIGVARTFSPGDIPPEDRGISVSDAQAFCSLISFILGCLASRLIPKSVPTKSRLSCSVSVFVQALLTFAAAIITHFGDEPSFARGRGNPSWTSASGYATLALSSAAMGLQGAVGSRLASAYATTVVLTSVYINLALEPQLFSLSKLIPGREQKIAAVLSAFVGGLFARAIIGQIGSANTLFIGGSLRIIAAVAWLFVRQKRPAKNVQVQEKVQKM